MKTVIRLHAAPPSVNHIWRHTRTRSTGKPVTYRSGEYMTWLRAVEWEAKAQAVKQPKWSSPVYLTIAVKRPRKNADIDNYLKACIDLLQRVGVITDDKLVHGVNAYWSNDVEGVEIAVTEAREIAA